ncbi:recombinase family protein [Amycolatopsis taiwanensis]|nr:recombinase family protein [Amycolatopsis taiwanensis]
MILANPRYTGRQVWNRHRTDHRGHQRTHRSNPTGTWVISAAIDT